MAKLAELRPVAGPGARRAGLVPAAPSWCPSLEPDVSDVNDVNDVSGVNNANNVKRAGCYNGDLLCA